MNLHEVHFLAIKSSIVMHFLLLAGPVVNITSKLTGILSDTLGAGGFFFFGTQGT